MPEILITPDNLHLISSDLANHYKILPKNASGNALSIYIDNHFKSNDVKDELELLLGKEIQFHPSDSSDIEKALSIYYRKDRETTVSKSLNIDKSDFLENLLYEAKPDRSDMTNNSPKR